MKDIVSKMEGETT